MNKLLTFLCVGILGPAIGPTLADDGQVRLYSDGVSNLVQVLGDDDEDWHFQSSTDLLTWVDETALGHLLAGGTNAPSRDVGSLARSQAFLRAVKSGGLYDPTVLRTIRLTFAASNWQSLLTSGRTTGSNTPCMLVMDNGATTAGVGARYRGNTSFTGMGGGGGGAPVKKSVNLELDYTDTDAHANAVLDTVSFGAQQPDRSYGRSAEDADQFLLMTPTPGAANR